MTKINDKKVLQYNLSGDFIASFDSVVLASKSTGVGRCSIQSNAVGRTKTGGRFIWKYQVKELKG